MEIADWMNAVKVCGRAVSRGVIMPIEPFPLALPLTGPHVCRSWHALVGKP